MGVSTNRSSVAMIFQRRWSTMSLIGASLVVGGLGYYFGGQQRVLEKKTTVTPVPEVARELVTREIVTTPISTESILPAPQLEKLEERWRVYLGEPRTPAVDGELADCLGKMAALDPKRAMTLALEQSDFKLREKLRDAVLRGWARVSPDDAAAWALGLALEDQRAALVAVLGGAAVRPEEAVRIGRMLSDGHPELAGEYGQLLIDALTETGAYREAVRFAYGDKTENQPAWLNATFFHWASHQPEAALQALGKISNPSARNIAFQGMIAGWAANNPVALAEYAMRLSPGTDRAQVLNQTLPEWVSRDPLGASEWMIRRFTPSPEMDVGVAAVATLPHLIADRPEIAVGWAENIAEPQLRIETFRQIAREWALRDAEGVRRFAATPNLSDEARNAFVEGSTPPGDRASEAR
jgi:hypothetical protein